MTGYKRPDSIGPDGLAVAAKIRLLGSGSRHLGAVHRPLVWSRLDEITARWDPAGLVWVHGACPTGFDAISDAWAAARGVRREPHPADWDSCAWTCPTAQHRRVKRRGDTVHPGMLPDYCPTAGPRRNALMVDLGAELLIAAPDALSLGTRSCMRLARAARIPVEVIRL